MGAEVDILLSTYNGSRYVEALIESVMKQTYPHIRLLVRDDGSSDGTPQILTRYAQRYPDRIRRVCDGRGNLGVTNSMLALLKQSSADYVIFCDQDDVWFADKTESLLRAIRRKEAQSPRLPMLVHCDAYTTDAELRPVDEDPRKALMSYQSGRDKRRTSFTNLLFCNPVQGASMICNRALCRELEPLLSGRIPKDLIYDSLIASVCAIRGKIFYLPRPLMNYRQHAANLVGAKRTSLLHMSRYQGKELDAVKTANNLIVNRTKCMVLKKYYRKQLSERQKEILTHVLATPNRWSNFFRLRLYREFGFRQILIMMIFRIE